MNLRPGTFTWTICDRCDGDGSVDHPAFFDTNRWVRRELLPRNGAQFRGRNAVATEETMQRMRYSIARLTFVEQQNLPSTPAQYQCGIQTGRSAPHDDDVPELDLL